MCEKRNFCGVDCAAPQSVRYAMPGGGGVLAVQFAVQFGSAV